MSIYSGFATRQQQNQYDNHVEFLLQNLQKRLLKFYRKQEADEIKFVNTLRKLVLSLQKMQKYKYLQPKLSESVKELYEYVSKQQIKEQISKFQQRENLLSIANINTNQNIRKLHPLNLIKSKNIINDYEKQIPKKIPKVHRNSYQSKNESKNKRSVDESHYQFKAELPMNKNYEEMAAVALQKFINPQKKYHNQKRYLMTSRNKNEYSNDESAYQHNKQTIFKNQSIQEINFQDR